MNKKKLLLSTGIMVASLVTALAVTFNDFDDKPLRAFVGPNAQYALNIENQNSSISNGNLVYERNDGKQFIFSTNGERNGDELITLGNGEYLEMITPVWNIESVIVHFAQGNESESVLGYAKMIYDPVEDNGKHGERAFGEDYVDYGASLPDGVAILLYAANMKYIDNPEETTEDQFLPNLLKIKNCDDEHDAIIESIVIEYVCH